MQHWEVHEEEAYVQKDSAPKERSPKIDKDELSTKELLMMMMEHNERTLEKVLKSKSSEGKEGGDDQRDWREDMKIKPVTLEVLEEASEGNSSIKCGDWLYRISPSITNLSRRTNEFWTKGMEVVKLRYEDYLKATPIERLTLEFPVEDIEVNPVYEKTRSTITEMILKAIPKDLASEATTKRLDNPLKILLLIMIKYQPGGRKEREAILKDITNPEACWYEDKALEAIRTWKRRLSRAKELKLIVPDPSVLLSALDNITEKVIKKDSRKTFRIETLREQLKIDVLPTSKAVEDLTKFIEAEL
jgi:hypothetical protein